jgi:4-amino-4-deoxy-L-arabinose transferase-like glycosyltransferase
MRTPGTAGRRDGLFLASAAGISALAAWLRFRGIDVHELWLDEAFSARMAVTDDFGAALLREYNPPLYYVLLRAWVSLFGETETALRSLSALAGSLFAPAVVAAGALRFGRSAGLWAGALAALAPLHVYYSQEARAYALLTLALLLAYFALWRALERGTRGAWALFSVASLLALLTHYLAAFALVPTGLAALAWPGRGRLRGWLLALAAAASPVAGWLAWSFLLRDHVSGGHAWIARAWEQLPPALAIPRSLEVLLFGSHAGLRPGFLKQFTDLAAPGPLRATGLLSAASLAVLALLPGRERRLPPGRRAPGGGWLALQVLGPLALLWAVSWLRPYYVLARYDLIAFPALVLLIGVGLARAQRLGAAAPLLGAVLALALFGTLLLKLDRYYAAPSSHLGPSARLTAAALVDGVGPGDLVLLTPGRGLGVGYYLRRLGYRAAESRCEGPDGRSFGCAMLAPDDQSLVLDLDHLERTRWSARVLRADVRRLLAAVDASHHAVWVERRLESGPHGRALRRILEAETARRGLERSVTPAPLRRLGFQRYAAPAPDGA